MITDDNRNEANKKKKFKQFQRSFMIGLLDS